MTVEDQQKRIEFQEKFGMSPERCKQIMIDVMHLINWEAEEIIRHLDYYENPTNYCEPESLAEKYGPHALEKDDDDDGYPNLYDYSKDHSAVELFQQIISIHTRYGGHTSAMEACNLMGLDWEE